MTIHKKPSYATTSLSIDSIKDDDDDDQDQSCKLFIRIIIIRYWSDELLFN